MKVLRIFLVCWLLIVQVVLVQFVQCQQEGQVFDNDYNGINTTQLNDPAVLNPFTELVYQRLSGVTSNLIHSQIAEKASFCVTDPEDDWNRSFNYSSNLDFLSKCILTTQGDLPRRLCTAAELKFYFTNFIAKTKSPATFLKPNLNCNLTKWVSGCEPGWACSADLTQPVNFGDSHEIPSRTSNCQPCCEGFFCPQGLTCMIPLLCKIAALRTFSLDKLQYRRERASGISSLAHFIAKDTIDHFNTLIKPLVYLSMFYFFSNPRSYFVDNYIVLLCLVYCVTGIAYALAIFLEPGPSQLCSVLLPVVLTLVSTQPKDSPFIKILTRLCYPSWALEAFIVSNAKSYYGVWLIQRCGALLKSGYNLHQWNLCISLLMVAGAACRALAFIGMLTLQKK
ncbi:hypothetical protein CDL12_28490 [Handroanthus impetiginosus]|uniref:ABC transporter family G domain-containing protein n=1 Tax=Handroanthus impetiginosus TaxID=429701 RepID=A0A2G9G157_9LAMI|nr:hypothetical protein CDL12_28490 [Handroanthus impetiginosus]